MAGGNGKDATKEGERRGEANEAAAAAAADAVTNETFAVYATTNFRICTTRLNLSSHATDLLTRTKHILQKTYEQYEHYD